MNYQTFRQASLCLDSLCISEGTTPRGRTLTRLASPSPTSLPILSVIHRGASTSTVALLTRHLPRASRAYALYTRVKALLRSTPKNGGAKTATTRENPRRGVRALVFLALPQHRLSCCGMTCSGINHRCNRQPLTNAGLLYLYTLLNSPCSLVPRIIISER